MAVLNEITSLKKNQYIINNGGSRTSWNPNDERIIRNGASKSTPQYGFRKGLKLFGDEGYQAAKDKLEANLLGRGCIDMLSWKVLTWDIRKRALGYLVFLKRKRSGKMKGRGCANGRPQRD